MTCCRDEADIIETFVRFYLECGFDGVHVIDNGSSDRSRDILAELIEEGLPVTIEFDDHLGYERRLTAWFRSTGEHHSPRWLFFLDCDEFILFPCPAKAYLAGLPPGISRLRLKQKEVYPIQESTGQSSHFLLSRRIERDFNDTTKDVTLFHRCARVYGGKHRVNIPQSRTLCPDDIFIRHYKYRSEAQAALKERNRCEADLTYSDADLRAISAFGLKRTKAWIQYCRQAALEGRWRDSFAPNIDAVDDHAMADWAQSFLSRSMGRFREPWRRKQG
jgi:glycosyltransferase involved in cell wall biosynthesis